MNGQRGRSVSLNAYKNSKYEDVDQREKLPMNIAFTQYDTDNNDKVEYEYNDSMIRNGGESDRYIVSEFGKNTILPWIRTNAEYFLTCTCENLLSSTLTKLTCNKNELNIDDIVDMSPPLVEEGKNYTKSTNWKSISIKHNNGEFTMLHLIVVQSLSHKIINKS